MRTKRFERTKNEIDKSNFEEFRLISGKIFRILQKKKEKEIREHFQSVMDNKQKECKDGMKTERNYKKKKTIKNGDLSNEIENGNETQEGTKQKKGVYTNKGQKKIVEKNKFTNL